jgi:hypothetical protein
MKPARKRQIFDAKTEPFFVLVCALPCFAEMGLIRLIFMTGCHPRILPRLEKSPLHPISQGRVGEDFGYFQPILMIFETPRRYFPRDRR